MIDLTRLNGTRLIVNCDLIKFAEASPDTTLSLVTGEKLIVRESCDDLVALIAIYRSHILAQAWPDGGSTFGARSATLGISGTILRELHATSPDL
jgi:flagellar protein FlbD